MNKKTKKIKTKQILIFVGVGLAVTGIGYFIYKKFIAEGNAIGEEDVSPTENNETNNDSNGDRKIDIVENADINKDLNVDVVISEK